MLCRCDGIGRRSGLKIHRWRQRTGSSPVTGTIKRLGSLEYGALTILSGCSAVGSAPALGAGCRRFESCHSDQMKSSANDFVCGTFSFIPAANVPMFVFCCFRLHSPEQGFAGVRCGTKYVISIIRISRRRYILPLSRQQATSVPHAFRYTDSLRYGTLSRTA